MSHISELPVAPVERRRSQLAIYVGRIREFDRTDWLVYLSWVGVMLGLVGATGGFVIVGYRAGVVWPAEAYTVPVGALIFTIAIAVDTIGHRTIYKEVLKGGEQLVHHITILCGVGSCVLLVLAYQRPGFAIPALVLTILSLSTASSTRRFTGGATPRITQTPSRCGVTSQSSSATAR